MKYEYEMNYKYQLTEMIIAYILIILNTRYIYLFKLNLMNNKILFKD